MTQTIQIKFKWVSTTPDPRPYKPGVPVLEPQDVFVWVDVPLKKDYVVNASDIIQESLKGGKHIQPVLTPKGMKHCMNEMETAVGQEPESQETDSWSSEFIEET